MDEFTSPTNLNATSDSSTTTIAKAFKIMSIFSTTDNGTAHCKAQVIVSRSLNSIDADRTKHEENSVIEIHYNRNELSGFQEELNIS